MKTQLPLIQNNSNNSKFPRVNSKMNLTTRNPLRCLLSKKTSNVCKNYSNNLSATRRCHLLQFEMSINSESRIIWVICSKYAVGESILYS